MWSTRQLTLLIRVPSQTNIRPRIVDKIEIGENHVSLTDANTGPSGQICENNFNFFLFLLTFYFSLQFTLLGKKLSLYINTTVNTISPQIINHPTRYFGIDIVKIILFPRACIILCRFYPISFKINEQGLRRTSLCRFSEELYIYIY